MNPPVPMKPSLREPQEARVDRVRRHGRDLLQRRSCLRSSWGSTWTLGILMRSPQIRTFATPGTRGAGPNLPVRGHRQVDEE